MSLLSAENLIILGCIIFLCSTYKLCKDLSCDEDEHFGNIIVPKEQAVTTLYWSIGLSIVGMMLILAGFGIMVIQENEMKTRFTKIVKDSEATPWEKIEFMTSIHSLLGRGGPRANGLQVIIFDKEDAVGRAYNAIKLPFDPRRVEYEHVHSLQIDILKGALEELEKTAKAAKAAEEAAEAAAKAAAAAAKAATAEATAAAEADASAKAKEAAEASVKAKEAAEADASAKAKEAAEAAVKAIAAKDALKKEFEMREALSERIEKFKIQIEKFEDNNKTYIFYTERQLFSVEKKTKQDPKFVDPNELTFAVGDFEFLANVDSEEQESNNKDENHLFSALKPGVNLTTFSIVQEPNGAIAKDVNTTIDALNKYKKPNHNGLIIESTIDFIKGLVDLDKLLEQIVENAEVAGVNVKVVPGFGGRIQRRAVRKLKKRNRQQIRARKSGALQPAEREEGAEARARKLLVRAETAYNGRFTQSIDVIREEMKRICKNFAQMLAAADAPSPSPSPSPSPPPSPPPSPSPSPSPSPPPSPAPAPAPAPAEAAKEDADAEAAAAVAVEAAAAQAAAAEEQAAAAEAAAKEAAEAAAKVEPAIAAGAVEAAIAEEQTIAAAKAEEQTIAAAKATAGAAAKAAEQAAKAAEQARLAAPEAAGAAAAAEQAAQEAAEAAEALLQAVKAEHTVAADIATLRALRAVMVAEEAAKRALEEAAGAAGAAAAAAAAGAAGAAEIAAADTKAGAAKAAVGAAEAASKAAGAAAKAAKAAGAAAEAVTKAKGAAAEAVTKAKAAAEEKKRAEAAEAAEAAAQAEDENNLEHKNILTWVQISLVLLRTLKNINELDQLNKEGLLLNYIEDKDIRAFRASTDEGDAAIKNFFKRVYTGKELQFEEFIEELNKYIEVNNGKLTNGNSGSISPKELKELNQYLDFSDDEDEAAAKNLENEEAAAKEAAEAAAEAAAKAAAKAAAEAAAKAAAEKNLENEEAAAKEAAAKAAAKAAAEAAQLRAKTLDAAQAAAERQATAATERQAAAAQAAAAEAEAKAETAAAAAAVAVAQAAEAVAQAAEAEAQASIATTAAEEVEVAEAAQAAKETIAAAKATEVAAKATAKAAAQAAEQAGLAAPEAAEEAADALLRAVKAAGAVEKAVDTAAADTLLREVTEAVNAAETAVQRALQEAAAAAGAASKALKAAAAKPAKPAGAAKVGAAKAAEAAAKVRAAKAAAGAAEAASKAAGAAAGAAKSASKAAEAVTKAKAAEKIKREAAREIVTLKEQEGKLKEDIYNYKNSNKVNVLARIRPEIKEPWDEERINKIREPKRVSVTDYDGRLHDAKIQMKKTIGHGDIGKPYEFNKVIWDDRWGNKSQKVVFEAVEPFIEKATIGGKASGIIAYGTSGSGKSFTMKDIVRKALPIILNTDQEVSLSFVELYYKGDNVKIRDLFQNDPVFQGKHLSQDVTVIDKIVISGVEKRIVEKEETAFRHFDEGNKARLKRGTDNNPDSSRSHSVFTIYIGDEGGQINFIDLAGNEKAPTKPLEKNFQDGLPGRTTKEYNNKLAQWKESNGINLSMMWLGLLFEKPKIATQDPISQIIQPLLLHGSAMFIITFATIGLLEDQEKTLVIGNRLKEITLKQTPPTQVQLDENKTNIENLKQIEIKIEQLTRDYNKSDLDAATPSTRSSRTTRRAAGYSPADARFRRVTGTRSRR